MTQDIEAAFRMNSSAYDEAIEALVKRNVLATEELTERQLAVVIRQALESGDLVRYVQVGGGQQVVYIPFAEVEGLKSRVRYLEGELEKLGWKEGLV
jgi:hypothetical protein